MNQSITTIGMLIGGLGLFLLAVGMITDGLKQAAGNALKNLLGKWTRTPGHGILTGISITAIVQSSSAVTVATIGFVNAGLLNMYQALGVVYGSNIGTTVTGWLVALIGFKIKVELFALPIIGVGMILRLTGSDSRRGAIGLALAGFGLFFIGVDVLREAFEGLAAAIDLQKFTLGGVTEVFLYVGVGFLMTVLTQSSSASIAITLTAATGGILGLYAAAAMVIGANLGTTSTAAFAVIGATSNAKRVAASHVAFNLLTAVVALMIMPLLFYLVNATGKILGLAEVPAVTLALFHTTFNILGVLLMWPLTRRLANFLERRFVTQEEIEGRARYLDKTVAVSPMLALNALALELSRIASITRRMALAVLSTESVAGKQIKIDHQIIEKLSNEVADFIARLSRNRLPAEVTERMAKLLRAEQHLLLCSEISLEIAQLQGAVDKVSNAKIIEVVARYRKAIVKLIEMTDLEAEDFSLAECNIQLQDIAELASQTKTQLLNAGIDMGMDVQVMSDILDQNSHIQRFADELVRGIRHIHENLVVGEVTKSATDEAAATDSETKLATT